MSFKRIKNSILLIVLLTGIQAFSQSSKKSNFTVLKTKIENYIATNKKDSILLFTNEIKALKYKTASDSLLGSSFINSIANSFYSSSDFFNSIKFFNQSISLAPNTQKGKNQKGVSMYDKAFAEYEIQNYYKSYQTVKQAEAILSDLESPNLDYLLSIYADLGTEASYLGFYEDAEFFLDKGFRIYKNNKAELKKEDKQSASKLVLFHYKYVYLYYLKRNETSLLKHLDDLEQLMSTKVFNATERLMLAVSYNNVGDYYLNLYQDQKPNSKALLIKGNKYLNKSIKLLDKKEQLGNYTQVLFNKAKFNRNFGAYKEALNINKELCGLVESNDERLPFFIAQKAMIALDEGDKQKALMHYYNMVKQIHSSDQDLKSDYSNFKPSNIVNHTGLLVEIADEFLKNFPNDTSVVKPISNFYDLGLKQLSNSYGGEWFSKSLKEYYEKALKGVLNSNTNGYGKSSNKSLVEKIEQLENRLTWKSFLQNRNLNTNSQSELFFDKEIYLRRKLVAARSNNDSLLVTQLTHKLNSHLISLKEYYPNIHKYVYSEFSIDSFQSSLDNYTVVLKYKAIDSLLYLFKITKTKVSIEVIPFSEKTKNQITKYLSLIKGRKEDKILAEEITKKIIPISIKSFQNVVVLPDDILQFLPFETLVNNNNQYLIKTHNLSYASHLVFVEQNNNKKKLDTVAVFSPNYNSSKQPNTSNPQALKGANEEALYISKLFNKSMLFKEHITKTQFIENAPKADLIHLAMHAEIDNSKPELSYFLFNKNEQNEKLYLEELYSLKLKANLAVLSACNTGFGITENAKGSISLQRAFIMAGVPATISSLWEAPDEATKLIMTNFYQNLKDGQSKSLALRHAKLKYINNIEDADIITPFYWAGFVVSGDNSAVVQVEKTSSKFLIILGVISLFIILFKLIKKS